jgi:hypothetical protein
MAAIDFDDLVATMGGSCIGQEAMDLKALHVRLSSFLIGLEHVKIRARDRTKVCERSGRCATLLCKVVFCFLYD